MLNNREIEEKMQELAGKLGYEYSDLHWLKNAMCANKVGNIDDGKHRKNYENDALATLGDSVLKFILTDFFYKKKQDKQYITEEKKKIESNEVLFRVFNDLGFYKYAYKDDCFYEDALKENHVSNSKHNQYMEAIIGAIYKDKGIEYAKEWVLSFFRKNNLIE